MPFGQQRCTQDSECPGGQCRDGICVPASVYPVDWTWQSVLAWILEHQADPAILGATPYSVVVAPRAQVTEYTVDAARGIVPLPVALRRIVAFNPTLTTHVRQGLPPGGVGGLSMVPLSEARSLGVDPRNPWGGLLLLLVRLRTVAELRLLQYKRLWDPIFEHSDLQAEDGEAFGRACGAVGSGQEYPELRCDVRYYPPECPYRGAYFKVAEMPRPPVMTSRWWPVPFTCETVFGGHPLLQVRGTRIDRWPEQLAYHVGFWHLVVMEEIGASREKMDRLWEEVLGHGRLSVYLRTADEGATLEAMQRLLVFGEILIKDVAAAAASLIYDYTSQPEEVRRRLDFGADDLSDLAGRFSRAREIVSSAWLPGEVPIFVPSSVRNDRAGDLESILRLASPWTSDTDVWWGTLAESPPGYSPVEPMPSPWPGPVVQVHDEVQPGTHAAGPSGLVTVGVPLVLVLGAALLGWGIWRSWRGSGGVS